jgi:hypothetical protein
MLMMASLQVRSTEHLHTNICSVEHGLQSLDPVSWSMIPCEEIDRARACERDPGSMIKGFGESYVCVVVLGTCNAWMDELTPTWSWRNLMYSMVSCSTDAVSVCTHAQREICVKILLLDYMCAGLDPRKEERKGTTLLQRR